MADAPLPQKQQDLTRAYLAILLMTILIGASFWILRPFLLSVIWAAMIVVATWPLMLRVQARLRRRALAVTLMSGAMIMIFVVPLALAIQMLVENTDTMVRWTKSLRDATIPLPPEWLGRVPVVGQKIADAWMMAVSSGKEALVSLLAPHATSVAQWIAGGLGTVGLGVGLLSIQFLLTVVIATIMYVNGETARSALVRAGRRLAGDRGEAVVLLAGQAIRAVALGVVVTALLQTVLAGIGLAVAGVPFAGFLTAVILVLCIAQVGPLLVLAPAVIWLFWTDQTGWAIALLVWTVIVGALDNVVRPILIRRGADLPLLLIFAGVIGGLLAFGIIGLFVGPVALAVTYTLLNDWVNEGEGAARAEAAQSRARPLKAEPSVTAD